jgi:nickel-dependent lactate racemase
MAPEAPGTERVELKYGRGTVALDVPQGSVIARLYPNEVDRAPNEEAEIRNGLEYPIGTPTLVELARGKKTAAIVIPDITRPLPRQKMLPPLLEQLNRAGILDSAIVGIFGLGTHRSHIPGEHEAMVGTELLSRIRFIDHRPEDCVTIGRTSRGTPVQVFSEFMEAELKLAIGEVELHYYAGYTGGAKAVLPGVSSKETVQQNHKMMLMPGSASGVAEGNPVREDMEEAAAMAGLDFVLNAVLDESARVIRAYAGDFVLAHRQGVKVVDQAFKVSIPRKADIVLVSPGGFPKDINLYQAQKAAENARYAVRDGGTMIVLAECGEGIGHSVFQEWIEEAAVPQDVIDRLDRQFVFGGHKAVAFARLGKTMDALLVSAMDKRLVEKAFLRPAASVQEAFDWAMARHGPGASIIVMPLGNVTLPVLGQDAGR